MFLNTFIDSFQLVPLPKITTYVAPSDLYGDFLLQRHIQQHMHYNKQELNRNNTRLLPLEKKCAAMTGAVDK